MSYGPSLRTRLRRLEEISTKRGRPGLAETLRVVKTARAAMSAGDLQAHDEERRQRALSLPADSIAGWLARARARRV